MTWTSLKLSGPLSQFQSLEFNQDGIRTLVHTLHDLTDSGVTREQQDILLDVLWPRLVERAETFATTTATQGVPKESTEAMLAAILDEVRGLKVAPDERSIAAALRTLIGFKQAELLTLQERAGEDARSGKRSTMDSAEQYFLEGRIRTLRAAAKQV